MKTLNEYLAINNNDDLSIGAVVLFEAHEIENFTDLQQVYEALFDKMFIVEEGLFSKIGKALSNLGDKAENFDKNLEEKKKKLSDAAKAAIENAKKKAGDTWDKVKTAYTNTVAQVDSALKASKDTIVKYAQSVKMKVEEVEAKIASIATAAMAKGGEIGKKIMGILGDALKAPAMIAYFTTTLAAVKCGIDTNTLISCIQIATGKSE